MVGDPMRRGISGGQKKRVTTGLYALYLFKGIDYALSYLKECVFANVSLGFFFWFSNLMYVWTSVLTLYLRNSLGNGFYVHNNSSSNMQYRQATTTLFTSIWSFVCKRWIHIFSIILRYQHTHTHTHRNRVDHLESITDALISTLGLIYLEKQWIYPLYLFKKYRFTILPDSWYESFSLTLQNASSFHNETVARPHIQFF